MGVRLKEIAGTGKKDPQITLFGVKMSQITQNKKLAQIVF